MGVLLSRGFPDRMSAKWVRAPRLSRQDQPHFLGGLGYHNYGDPWQEQRYSND